MINGHKKEYFLTFPLYNPSLVLYQNKIFIDSNKRPFFRGGGVYSRVAFKRAGAFIRSNTVCILSYFFIVCSLYPLNPYPISDSKW